MWFHEDAMSEQDQLRAVRVWLRWSGLRGLKWLCPDSQHGDAQSHASSATGKVDDCGGDSMGNGVSMNGKF